MMDGQITNIALGEIRSVLATIAEIEADSIRAWMIVIERAHGCGDPACQAGEIAVLNSSAGEYSDSTGEPTSLRLTGELIQLIAQRMAGDGE